MIRFLTASLLVAALTRPAFAIDAHNEDQRDVKAAADIFGAIVPKPVTVFRRDKPAWQGNELVHGFTYLKADEPPPECDEWLTKHPYNEQNAWTCAHLQLPVKDVHVSF